MWAYNPQFIIKSGFKSRAVSNQELVYNGTCMAYNLEVCTSLTAVEMVSVSVPVALTIMFTLSACFYIFLKWSYNLPLHYLLGLF